MRGTNGARLTERTRRALVRERDAALSALLTRRPRRTREQRARLAALVLEANDRLIADWRERDAERRRA